MGTRVLARLQTVWIVLNIALILAVLIGLPATTPKEFMNSASYAFGNFDDVSAWPNGFAFILSFLAPLWAIGAFDSTLHISEEAANANIAVPWAMISACSIASILGFGARCLIHLEANFSLANVIALQGVNVALAFCMGTDIDAILASPIEQPLATLTSASRQTFAFARDGALPFSRWIYRINAHTSTPVNAVWFTALMAALLALLAFAGPAAIGAVFSLAVLGQYVAYSTPITARFLGGQVFKPGPFNLGRFSLLVAIIAVIWMTFMSVIFVFPASPAPDAVAMNYAVVVLGGVLVLSVVYFYLPKYGGVHWFEGPRANIYVGDDDAGLDGLGREKNETNTSYTEQI
ncbi:hypothetical protein HWV62_13765 [Athelia sp. TMB]|nr:hypothetical protein HWV62_13765 [Athelia sp. TMB]